MNVVSRVLRKCFAPAFVSPVHRLKNKLYCYAVDCTFVAVVPSPVERGAVTESLNRDLNLLHFSVNILACIGIGNTNNVILKVKCTKYFFYGFVPILAHWSMCQCLTSKSSVC